MSEVTRRNILGIAATFKRRRSSAVVVLASLTSVLVWMGFVRAYGQREDPSVPPTPSPATRSESTMPILDSDGALHVSSWSVPFSVLASAEAKRDFVQQIPLSQSFHQK